MTKDKCLKIAMRQSALELGCRAEDFVCGENIALPAAPANPAARRYLSLPQDCALVSYGTNVVAAASDRLLPDVREYISRYAAAHCFETPNLLVLEDALRAHGFRVCFMAEFFCRIPRAWTRAPAAFRSARCIRWILRRCICLSGAMRFAAIGAISMCWGWARMTGIVWWGLRPVPPTVRTCGRSAWTFCLRTVCAESPRR